MPRDLKPVPTDEAPDTSEYPSFADFQRDRRAFFKALAAPVVLAAVGGLVTAGEASASEGSAASPKKPKKPKKPKLGGKPQAPRKPEPRERPRNRGRVARPRPPQPKKGTANGAGSSAKKDKSCGGDPNRPAPNKGAGKRDRPRTKGEAPPPKRPAQPDPPVRQRRRLGGAPPPPAPPKPPRQK